MKKQILLNCKKLANSINLGNVRQQFPASGIRMRPGMGINQNFVILIEVGVPSVFWLRVIVDGGVVPYECQSGVRKNSNHFVRKSGELSML
jgi:hypothetical protein